MASGLSGCWREKASSRWVRLAARLAASAAASSWRLARGSASPIRRLSRSSEAHDDGQHVVEIVGDAAGQLAHGFHLLGLPQRLLGMFQRLGLLLFGGNVAGRRSR